MMTAVFIEPHERGEAIEAYASRLTFEQIDQIQDAPDGALVRLDFGIGGPGATVTIIEEG